MKKPSKATLLYFKTAYLFWEDVTARKVYFLPVSQ